MAMIRKTVTIPDAMEEWIKSQIDSGHYGNDSEYIRDLIRRDQERKSVEQELRLLIEEGLNSGISSSTIPSIMKRVEARLGLDGDLPAHE